MSLRQRQNSEIVALRREREAQRFEFTISPFSMDVQSDEPEGPREEKDEPEETLENEIRVNPPEEVPWTDLLLEISMTTAFSSLTDGTPILETKDAVSYVFYFAFVWWIWVSQVAYDLRFRQADVLHRVWMFLQLGVFSALAAFTKDFDITNGLIQNSDEVEIGQLLTNYGFFKSSVDAFEFRTNHLPLVNARGVSITMAVSRALLLAQYLVVYYHAKNLKRKSLLTHISSLVFSFFCYLAAFLILGTRTISETTTVSQAVAIGKIVLWYLPIFVEIVCHFVALHKPHFVRYPTENVYKRVGTVFIIILGAGLDKITGGFKIIVGNGGLGADGVPLFIAASVIFIGFFILFFSTPANVRHSGRKRVLTWFFAQFFFVSALIISLQGIATSLQFANINDGLIKVDKALEPLFRAQTAHPNVNLTTTDPAFSHSAHRLRTLGIALEPVIEYLNYASAIDQQPGFNGTIARARLQLEASVIDTMLVNLESPPSPTSLLSFNLDIFLNTDLQDTDELTQANLLSIKEGLIRQRGSSGLWFYPAVGATILCLGLFAFVRGFPRDTWERKIVACRIVVGGTLILLTLLNIGYSKPLYDDNGKLTSCLIWRLILSKSHAQLILMAIVMFLLLVLEYCIAYYAKQSYISFKGKNIFPGMSRAQTYDEVKVTPSFPPSPLEQSRSPVYTDDSFDPYRGVSDTAGSPWPGRG